MKTMFLAAAAILSIGIGSAYAGEGGPIANTFFTELPGVVPQAPAQLAPSAVTSNQSGTPTHVYVSHSATGTWLFPPNPNQGANS
jgi:hypothetical protein